MTEIKRMFHKSTGEIVFEDVNGDWFMQEYNDYNPITSTEDEWMPVVATKIEKPNPEECEHGEKDCLACKTAP